MITLFIVTLKFVCNRALSGQTSPIASAHSSST